MRPDEPGAADDEAILAEQVAYYRARAPEYDEWWARRGRYDHGPAENARWRAEIAEVRSALAASRVGGDILELAAGTGIWSEVLAPMARTLTCVDASPETLAQNRRRLGPRRAHVRHVVADLFAWRPERRYDSVFFSFWLSHVPPERLPAFWAMVAEALAPGGTVFLVDSRYAPTSTAVDHRLGAREAVVRERLLNDGRSFRIVKVFHDRESLAARLAALGFACDLAETATHFLYGSAWRAGTRPGT